MRVLERPLRGRGHGERMNKGRIWTFVRDQRSWAGRASPGVAYHFTPEWMEEHVRHHLRRSSVILQADGYEAYAKPYRLEPGG